MSSHFDFRKQGNFNVNEPLPLENKALLNVLNMLEGWIHIIGLRNVLHEEICHAVAVSSGIL